MALVLGAITITSCNENESYAKQLERQSESIDAFINKHKITVISESQFANQGYKTDTTKHQYVKFNNNGVYMQIVNEGSGEKLKKGETATVLCRFDETNLLTDTVQLTNRALAWDGMVDKMMVTNTSGTFTATFDASSSVMQRAYRNTMVPSGWLVPLTYINLGRIAKPDDKLAHVRLIVPSSQGHKHASDNVYACFYDITYQRGV